MAEILVKKSVCSACGSDARHQALFCYHCGGPLETAEVSTNENLDEPSDVWFRGDISEDSRVTESKEKEEILDEKSEESEGIKEELVEEENLELKESKKEIEDEEKNSKVKVKSKTAENDSETNFTNDTKLKSASALRNKEKPTRLKKVEIVWEEHENSPNFLFIVFALLLTLLVAALIIVAFYLK